MATDPWAIDNSGGLPSYAGAELRLTTVTPHFAGAGVSLGVYSGVRLSGSGTDLLVQAQSSPNMTVKVNPGIFIAQGAISSVQGAYSWALDTLTNLTISAAHATLSRTDLIVVRVRDANVDTSGGRDASVVVITGTAGSGTPALPTDASYFTIAQITVPAAVTTIGGGGGGTIADKRTFCAALGGVVPFVSTARPASMMDGQPGWETDTGLRYTYRSATTKWMRDRQILYLTTGWTSAVSTYSDVVGITFSGDASSTYYVDGWASTVATSAGDIGLQWVLPTGATLEWGVLSPAATNAGTTLDTTIYQGTVVTAGGLAVGGVSSTGAAARVSGIIVVAGTAGTCKLQANNLNANGNSFIRQMYLNVMQVA